MSFINFCGPEKTDNKEPVVSKPKQNEYVVNDLSKMTLTAVLDLKHRQSLLLQNKERLKRLPDKGARVQQLYDKAVAELERRADIDKAAELFSKLNIATRAIPALNALEWSNGRANAEDLAAADPMQDVIDSDDEAEFDPLRIIAGGNMHKRRVRLVRPQKPLITAQDLEDIKSMQAAPPTENKSEVVNAELINVDVAEKLSILKPKLQIKLEEAKKSKEIDDEHLQQVIKKVEEKNVPMREKFKPYKTTISNVHDLDKERMRKKAKNWENTAATPPAIRLKETQLLTLTESVDLQKAHLSNLKKFQEQQAMERLAARMERLSQRENIKLPSDSELKTNSAFTAYRVHNLEGELQLKEEDEVHDPTDEDRGGGVNYTYSE